MDKIEQPGSSSATTRTSVATGNRWRRLAPIAVLYFIASNIKSMVQNALYIIPALAISAQSTGILQTRWFFPMLAALLVLMIGSGLISYLFYQFRVRNGHVEIRMGLLRRRHINLPFWRIQNIKVERPFYYRLTQFAVVILDTAGSAKEEAKIVAVTRQYAARLRAEILSERNEFLQTSDNSQTAPDASVSKPADQSSDKEDRVINRRSVKDLVIHGITNNRVWIVLGAMAPFYDDLARLVGEWLEQQGLQLEQLAGSASVAWWQWGLYAFTIIMIIMAAMALFSVGGSLLTYYGYTLTRSGDRYIRKSGLLSQQEVSMRQSRVQMVAVKQDWLDRILRRANIFFEQNKTGNQQGQELMAPNKLLVPSVTLSQASALCEEVLPSSQPFSRDFSPITGFYLVHMIGVRVLPILCLLLVVLGWQGQWQAMSVALGAATVLSGVIWLRFRCWGFARDKNYLYVRSGIVGKDYQILPLYKIQQVVIQQSIMMRRRNLATIRLILASGTVSIPFLTQKQISYLSRVALAEVEVSAKSWM